MPTAPTTLEQLKKNGTLPAGALNALPLQPFVNPLSPKFLTALTNGVIKRQFYSDRSITIPFLQEQLFADSNLEADAQVQLIHSFSSALQQAASENWSSQQVQQHFQQGGLTEEQSAAVEVVWKKEAKKVHDHLVSLSSFSTPHFQSLDWRVDVASHSRHQAEVNQPTAIVQIQTKSQLATSPSTHVTRTQQLQFEMDRSTVAHVLLELEKIDAIMSAGAQ